MPITINPTRVPSDDNPLFGVTFSRDLQGEAMSQSRILAELPDGTLRALRRALAADHRHLTAISGWVDEGGPSATHLAEIHEQCLVALLATDLAQTRRTAARHAPRIAAQWKAGM
jgi:hypothetical protein